MKNNCGNCKFWKQKEGTFLGNCHAPVPEAVEVKIKRQTLPSEGYDCGAHEPK